MNLVILGPQGSGKGTQAKLLAQKLNLVHISSGELLRLEAQKTTPKGQKIAGLLTKGILVPFDTVLEVIEPVLKRSQAGFIIDGTPRDLRQAEHLDWFLAQNKQKIDWVIYLNIPRSESLKRLLKRAQIESRSDDTPESINRRLDIYEKETAPVIDFYRHQKNLIAIDGLPDVDTIQQNILKNLTVSIK